MAHQNKLTDGLDPESTMFVWQPVTPKNDSSETRVNLSRLVRQGIIEKGANALLTVHEKTGALVLSEYKSQIERDSYHDGIRQMTIRTSGRLGLPVGLSDRTPKRKDRKHMPSGDTEMDKDTTIVPIAFAKSIYQGRPVVYLMPEDLYRRIENVLLDPVDEDSDAYPDRFTFVYWSKRVVDEAWDEPHWPALKVEPGTFKGPVLDLVRDSDLWSI